MGEKRTISRTSGELARLVDALPYAAFAKSYPELRYLAWNDEAVAVLGRPREAVVGRTDRELFPESLAERFIERDLAVGTSRGVVEGEKEVHRPDGVVRRVHTRKVAIVDEAGEPWAVLGVMHDITRAHEDAERVRRSDARWRTLSAHAPVGIFRAEDGESGLPHDIRVEWVNEFLQQMTGDDPVSLRRAGWMNRLHEDDRARIGTLWAAAYSAGTAFEGECRIRSPRGLRTVIVSTVPQRAPDGRIEAWIGTVHDVTEQRAAEAALLAREKQTREELEQALQSSVEQLRRAQKLEAVGRLAGGIAHDFNNLLAVVLTNAEIALARAKADPILVDELSMIREAGMRGAALTRQLLAFSRQQVVEVRPVDVNDALRGFEKLLRRVIGEDVELHLRLSEEGATVLADPGQLEQVLMNVAVNARDAMPNGGRLDIATANVEVTTEQARRCELPPGAYVRLTIADTGHGMERETQRRVFEPFFSTKEKGRGSGLGLSTVYGIVRQFGGHVWLESEVGRGTTFHILLPRTESTASAERAPEAMNAAHGSETILVVEDDDLVRRTAVGILERAGYRVLQARNGAEAVGIASLDRFDLLLTDVVMPGLSGRELLARVSSIVPSAKVLFMSGYTDVAITREDLARAAFLQKPFDSQTLTARVREVLDA